MLSAITENKDIKPFLYNDLEYAVFDDYKELQKIKTFFPNAIMSGSGSTYFLLEKNIDKVLDDSFEVFENLEFITHGVCMTE